MDNIDQDNQNQINLQNGALRHSSEGAQAEDTEGASNNAECNLQSQTNYPYWKYNDKVWLVRIDMEERAKGPGFMKRVHERWHKEFPGIGIRTAQNLCDNAKRFKKERSVISEVESGHDTTDVTEDVRDEIIEPLVKVGNVRWTTNMKVRLVEIDTEERLKGRGFMVRMKARWDNEFRDYSDASGQKLRDNARRFRNEKEIANLVLLRKRESENGPESTAVDKASSVSPQDRDIATECQDDEEREWNHPLVEKEKDESYDRLEAIFKEELEKLAQKTLEETEQREKLPKLRMLSSIEKNANLILCDYLDDESDMKDITDVVYAMGKATARAQNVKPKGLSKTVPGGNRRERKLRSKIKALRQIIARICNELHRRKTRRKPTNKEKRILKEISSRIEGNKTRTVDL
eukprot:Seg2308.5 transcript_id=Seg2308.5/GoldUCD/mRNA.D3Y31 product="hypothetical protein" protein_id=Seg2308.5/GoldUCD/D3Y31